MFLLGLTLLLLCFRNTSSGFITDDCQALGSTHSYRATDDSDSTAQLKGTGDIVSCMSQVKDLLNKHAPCRSYPCSINGTHQPAIPPQSMFYGISEYWYSTYDVLNLRGYYNLNNTIRHAEVSAMSALSLPIPNSR